MIGHLQRHGQLEREGGRHTIYANPANGTKAPVPRRAEIDNRLARKTSQQLNIGPKAELLWRIAGGIRIQQASHFSETGITRPSGI